MQTLVSNITLMISLLKHSHTKRKSVNDITSFVYVMFLPWLVPSLFTRGQNLAESFNNKFKHKVLEEI